MKRVYLDWAATAIPDAEALSAALNDSLETYANPASAHESGKKAHEHYEESRAFLASTLGCNPEELIATSGGTESNALALLSLLRNRAKTGTVLVSAIEHDSVYRQALVLEDFGYRVKLVRPDTSGIVTVSSVLDALTDDTVFVSVMAVNNETGAIEPVAAITEALAAKQCRAHVHVDAVQAFGKFPITLTGIDSLAASAHKIGGPKGFGFLYRAKSSRLESLMQGGGQERGVRSGTQNLFGMRGFALALKNRDRDANLARAQELCSLLIEGIKNIPGAVLLPEDRSSNDSRFSPYIVSCAFPGLTGEVLVRLLSDRGIDISTGSACSSAHKERRILDAMRVDRRVSLGAIRVSTGPSTTEQEINMTLEALADCVRKFRT